MDAIDAGAAGFLSPRMRRPDRNETNPLNEREGLTRNFASIRQFRTHSPVSPSVRTWLYFRRRALVRAGGVGLLLVCTEPTFIHGDLHALWINPANPSQQIVGATAVVFQLLIAGALGSASDADRPVRFGWA